MRGIVFDLDGTLVDSYEAITESLNHARARCGLTALECGVVRQRVGHGLERLIAELVGPDHVESGVRLFRERYEEVYIARTLPLAGARRALSTLSAGGYRMSVATNKPARFASAILRSLEMDPPFDCIAGPDVVASHKPEPEMIRYCLRRMDVDRASSLYVGDMVLDVESAARAGVPVVLVEGGSSSAGELRATGETVLASVADLPRWLPGLTKS